MHSIQCNIKRLRVSGPQPFLRLRPAVGLWLLALLVTHPAMLSPVQAWHPISVTETHVFVTQTSARARIQLFAEDLLLFQELEPDGDGVLSESELQRGLQLHREFLVERVTLRDADGDLIPSKVTDVVPFEIPEEGIPEEDLMLYQATYELEFQFESPPEFLTFQQDITDENFILPSEMKLAIQQTGTGNMIAGTLNPGSSVTHRFDWDAPLDVNASDEEYESWLEKQREDTLGITSYSSVYSFIYIDPGEVRHEILIPLASLATILPIERADPAFLEVEEQEAVRVLIRDWLTGGNPVRINGTESKAEFSRIDFYGLSLRDFAQQSEARRVSFASGRVGIILRYLPADNFVTDLELNWDTFHSTMRRIRSVVIPWSGEPGRFEFSRFKVEEDNIFRWSADESAVPELIERVSRELPPQPKMRLPVLSCVLLGCAVLVPLMTRRRWQSAVVCLLLAAVCWPFVGIQIDHPFRPVPQLTPDRAQQIAEHLHSGTYQALDFGSERRIYESLDRFVDGELLETLYLQLRDGLQVREQGGAVARVESVEHLDGELVESGGIPPEWPGFRFRSTWVVAGTVEHWGHVHERRNQFSAMLRVEPQEGTWKITQMDIDSQESLPGSTRLRQF